VTTFRLSDAERKHVEAFELFVDSVADWFDLEEAKDGAPPPMVPNWVNRLHARLDATLYAPANASLASGEVTPYRAGYALGLVFWSKESLAVKSPPELRAARRGLRLSKAGRRAVRTKWNTLLLRAGILEKRGSRFIPGLSQPIRRIEKMAEKYSAKESSEYHRGYSDGLRGLGQDAPGDRSTLATDIYFAMMIWWRYVARLNSVAELHLWLSRVLTPAKVGELKRVEKISQRIGLRFRQRGRPKKIQTQMVPG
jgi:hypothetical protein